jgi:hypothetical protein
MSASDHAVVHTPGPWRTEQRHDRIKVEPDIAVVYVQQSQYDGSQSKTRTANAKLIAAAPDLIAACLAFIEADNQCGANLAFVMAQEAVKKAGVSPKENGGETCDMKCGPCSCGATH